MRKLRSPILLRCPKCNRTGNYDRKIDDAIPNDVKTIVVICPGCDDGDFHGETWLDACGFELTEAFEDA
jgi:hypothetical protein